MNHLSRQINIPFTAIEVIIFVVVGNFDNYLMQGKETIQTIPK